MNIKISDAIHLIDPVGYLEMIWLESNCELVCTDSGGVQKEAYFFHKPCLTIRDETEWIELLESGWNKLVGSEYATIVDGLNNFKIPKVHGNLYGNGNSAELIVNTLSNY